jgi:hypothetical protein
MSNRGGWTLCFLLLAGKLSAQTATIDLYLYDYAALQPSTFNEFVARTENILKSAGLSFRVAPCKGVGTPQCEVQTSTGRHLAVRVLPGTAKTMQNAMRAPLGESFADHDGGTYASLFLSRVQDEAAEANVPWVTVLAYAAAHEIGHLLLGDQAHTPRGLMKAHWDSHDYQAMNQNCFHFSDEQIRQLKSRYPVPSQADTRAGLGMVAGN